MKKIIVAISLLLIYSIISALVPIVSATDIVENDSSYYPRGLIESSPGFYETTDNALDVNMSNKGSRDYSNLPSFVDLSDPNASDFGQYFPSIANQYDTGSCAAFATAYYQFTYEANKYKSIPASQSTPFCPQFVYSITQLGDDMGSSFEDSFEVLENLGCLTYDDYSNNAYDANNWQEFLYYSSTNTDAKIEALNLRADLNTINVPTFDYYDSNNVLHENKRVIDFGPNATHSDGLDTIKAELASGKVLTTEVRYSRNFLYSPNKNMYAMVGSSYYSSRHAMTIVGYDDGFWVDLNSNGVQDPEELGAFKVADSYGTTSTLNHFLEYHYGGYIWILYDALNEDSCCENQTYPISNRIPTIAVYNDVIPFYEIDIVEKDVKFIGKINFTTNKLRSLLLNYRMFTLNNVSPSWSEYPCCDTPDTFYFNFLHSNVQDTYYYNMIPSYSFTGDLIFDCSDYFEAFSGSSYWFTSIFEFYAPLGGGTINSISIIDSENNTVTSCSGMPITLSYTQQTIPKYFTLYKGDLNYDGIINATDKSILVNYIVENIQFSNLQYFLADLNGDGIVNSRDSKLLSLLINNYDIWNMTEAEQDLAYNNLVQNFQDPIS